jgi:hypothetical protein
MFLTVMVYVNLFDAKVSVEHPDVSFKAPVVVGKALTPTPTGVYVLEKMFSKQLNMPILAFKREGKTIYAIHPNLPSREKALKSETSDDNRLSAGCIGMDVKLFDKLYKSKRPLVLQVY